MFQVVNLFRKSAQELPQLFERSCANGRMSKGVLEINVNWVRVCSEDDLLKVCIALKALPQELHATQAHRGHFVHFLLGKGFLR